MKDLFRKYQAQTSPHPMELEVQRAEGSYVYDTSGKTYLDFIAGVSANTLGHQPTTVIEAIKSQLDQYMHVMVYGEFIQKPQAKLCEYLVGITPSPLDCVYLTNSGTEATEGALKLAKRVTGRSQIIAARNAYHGNTQGAMSVCGKEEQNSAYRPLIPGTKFIRYNNLQDLEQINKNTAAVILETIQGGAGFIVPENNYLFEVKKRCEATGTLLILDEIQTGIGRTGKWFGFEHYNVIPDILITGKGLGGGMPIGAFIASNDHMRDLADAPKLGHITTFGGHPVIASAALATLETIHTDQLISTIDEKEALFRKLLVHPKIKEIRGKGLMLALLFDTPEQANQVILSCLDHGLLLFWLLFEPCAVRISPPLTISKAEIEMGCSTIISVLNSIQ